MNFSGPKPHGPIAVSPSDVDLVMQSSWQRHSWGYAKRGKSLGGSRTTTEYLHRLVVGVAGLIASLCWASDTETRPLEGVRHPLDTRGRA